MRLAVISDIHGNLTALEAVLADLAAAGGADLTWCLGDLAAFGPRPAECVQRVRALAEADEGKTFKVIGGNTDRYLVNGSRHPTSAAKDEQTLRDIVSDWHSRDAVLNWNAAQLNWQDYEFLAKICGQELAHDIAGYGWALGFHAAPGDDEQQITAEMPPSEVLDALLDREGRLAFVGHTHVQMNRDDLGRWQVINPGSVGQASDFPGLACYGLFTFEDGQMQANLRRVPYDMDIVFADLRACGHPDPEWAVERLRSTAG